MPRNVSGVYTLPAGNPVVPSTIIATTWANPTMSDIGNELTNSLDRAGRGAMTAQLKIVDGTVGVPGWGFNAETTTGMWRSAAGVMAATVLGATVWAASVGQFATVAGAVATPSHSFIGDLNTGMWSPGADTLAWSVGGAEALRTTTTLITAGLPFAAPLGAVGTPSYSFTGDLNNGWWSPAADTQAWSIAGAESMRLTSTGLGIGGIPTRLLDLQSGSGLLFRINSTGANGAYMAFATTGAFFGYLGSRLQVLGAGSASDLSLRSDAALTISAGGGSIAAEVSAGRNWTFNAPTGGNSLDVTQLTGQFGLIVRTGTTANDAGLLVSNIANAAAGTRSSVLYLDPNGANGSGGDYAFWEVLGNGQMTIGTQISGDVRWSATGTVGLTLTSDRRLYGSALHNNAGAVTGTTNQYIASGTYNPTGFTGTNITTVSPTAGATWIRVGNVVTVGFEVQITASAAGASPGTSSSWGMSIPIASNFAGSELNGAAASQTIDGPCRLFTDVANDRLSAAINCIGATGTRTLNGKFQYLVA